MYNISCAVLAVCVIAFYVSLFVHNTPLLVVALVVAFVAVIVASATEEV